MSAAIALSLMAAPAMAADPAVPEYRRTAGGFTCVVAATDTLGARLTAMRDLPCRRIGPLTIGMLRAEAEMALGMPTDMQLTGGNQYFLYSLKPGADVMPATYVVMAYDYEGKTVIIQLTGEPWEAAWRFNGVTLGDTEQTVTDRLGAALQMRPSSVPDAALWSYAPWPFTFEITAGLVTAVRLTAQ